MLTQFIFIKEQEISSLVLDEHSHVTEKLVTESLENFKPYLTPCKTIIVVPCEQFSLHQVELPLLNDKKARLAIPYALEENLTQAIEDLHFAFDRNNYSAGHYLVAVCQLNYIKNVIKQLNEKDILFDEITIDWFALNPQEYCVLPNNVLIHNHNFQGALDLAIAQTLLETNPEKPTIFTFKNSDKKIFPGAKTIKMPVQGWIAQRLLPKKRLNLCQGELQQENKTVHLKRWYQLAAALCGLWLLSIIIFDSYWIYVDNRQIKQLDQNIETIYKHFFPTAKQIISPKFRVTQYLKSDASSPDVGLWILLSKLTQQLEKTENKVQEIYWQNHRLQVKIASPNFKSLNELQQKLKQANLHVKQNQASTQDNLVMSTLELSL